MKDFKPHYYIDTTTRERKVLPDEHLHHELEILPVISGTFILIDCDRLRDGAEPEPTFYLSSGYCEEDIPF